ncbi:MULTISPECIES: hypothetical protein [unclassified Bartonella]|nr:MULTISPECIES: hypothetical protein [unclassified Bartonella]
MSSGLWSLWVDLRAMWSLGILVSGGDAAWEGGCLEIVVFENDCA